MTLRQQSPQCFVGFVRVVGHFIEHKQMRCIFQLVVIDDHLNALFVHASLPPLHPQEKTAASFALRSARRFSRLIKAVTPRSTPFDDEDGITQYTPFVRIICLMGGVPPERELPIDYRYHARRDPGTPRLFFHKNFKPVGACAGYSIARLFFPGHFIPAPFFNEGTALVRTYFL
jgi:hypothetical protein